MIPCIFSKSDGKLLEPMTLSMPVSLFPMCNKPLVNYQMDMLRKNGFNKAIISILNRQEAVEEYLSANNYRNFNIICGTENIPDDEDILLINADTFYNISLGNALKFHKNMNSDITVITKSVMDCRSCRAVFTENDKKILSFQDNPSYMDCVSVADTGIYILSARIFRMIENFQTISAEILNRFISENFSVYSYECIGYFCNINSIKNYIKCQNDIITSNANADINGHRTLDGTIINGSFDLKRASLEPPLCLGDNVRAETGTVIDGMSVIGNNVTIGKNSVIHNCIIMDDVYIGENVSCSNAVICKGAVLLNSSSVHDNCIIGFEAIVGENTTIKNNSSVWNYKNTGNSKTINFPVRYGHSSELNFDENGISGETNAVFTSHTAVSVGMTAGKKGKSYVIGYSGKNNSSYSMALAVASGIMSSGGNVWNIGDCLKCEFDYAIKNLEADMGIYIEADNITRMIICSKNALPLTSEQENNFEYSLNHHIYGHCLYNETGHMNDASIYRKLYIEKLSEIIPKKLNCDISVNTSDRRISELCRTILKDVQMYKNSFSSLVFHISSDSRKISAYSELSGFVFHERLIMICCLDLFKKGLDITLPYGIINSLENIAYKYGRTVYRYSERQGIPENYELPPDFINDAFMLMIYILKILSERNISLADAEAELPRSEISSKFISIEKSPEKVIKKLCGKSFLPYDGTVINSEKGNVSIKMSRSGKSMMICAESSNYEFARELCDFVEKTVNENDNI